MPFDDFRFRFSLRLHFVYAILFAAAADCRHLLPPVAFRRLMSRAMPLATICRTMHAMPTYAASAQYRFIFLDARLFAPRRA